MAKFSEIMRALCQEDHTTLEGYESATLRLYGKGKKRLMKFYIKDSDLAMVGGTHTRLTVQGDVFYIGDEFYDTSDEYEQSVPGAAVRVIYNPPATIAFWADGSKTVVKCDKDDVYDPKYGLALCYMKKALGSSRAFNDALRAGRNCNNAAMDFLTKHKISEYMLSGPHKDIFKNICPVEGVPCRSCPYVLLPEAECVKKIRDDIKAMREGEKHD